MKILSTLANGMQLFNDDWWNGWLTAIGIVKTHDLPVIETDQKRLLEEIDKAGGFGFAVTRRIKAEFYQRHIDGVTRSPWGHAVVLIGEKIGRLARLAKPGLMIKKPSPRWEKIPGRPVPWVEGIRPMPSKFEIVESKAVVAVDDLTKALGDGEQVIVFTNPRWSEQQKIAMACEAYSWVGEPYDIWEIGSYVMPLMPNPKRLKACSTLTLQAIAAGDPGIRDWCKYHGLDPERVPPRDIFAYGADTDCEHYSFRCAFADAEK